MCNKFKIFMLSILVLCGITSCVIMDPFRENKIHEDTYIKKMPALSLTTSEEHSAMQDDMYQMIKNPTLQNNSVNSAYPLKMTWIQVEDGDWYISKVESDH